MGDNFHVIPVFAVNIIYPFEYSFYDQHVERAKLEKRNGVNNR